MAINDDGGSGGGGGSGVGGLGPAIEAIIKASKKDKKSETAATLGFRTLRNQQMLETVEQRIDEDVRAGRPIRDSDLRRRANIQKRIAAFERRFEKKQARGKAVGFKRHGIGFERTLAEVVQILSGTRKGQQIIARRGPTIFSPAPLPTPQQGGSTVPFVITPGASEGDAFGGFGQLLNSVIKAGGQIGSALLAPNQPQPQFQQAGLIPFGSAVGPLLPQVGRALGGIGAGAVGGEIADAFQNLVTGGASSQDDTAAFTDPVPGSCRPKAHLKVNPCTGKGIWFVPRGRPLVFSGDLSACKRVDRVAKRLNKSMPKKRSCSKR